MEKLNFRNKMLYFIKLKVRSADSSEQFMIKKGAQLLRKVWHTWQNTLRLITDKQYRSIIFLQLFKPNKVHQTTPFTYYDRYPQIFNTTKQLTKNKENIKILSYGCSTGEEVVTLRSYFPSATIIGAEINKASLATCKKRIVDEKVKFIYSSKKEILKHGPYDIIFCMAVLQRKPQFIQANNIKDISAIYPFQKFNDQLMQLDTYLKPEGILSFYYAQYSFLDTEIANYYDPLGPTHTYKTYSVFNKEGKLLYKPSPQFSIYRKKKIVQYQNSI